MINKRKLILNKSLTCPPRQRTYPILRESGSMFEIGDRVTVAWSPAKPIPFLELSSTTIPANRSQI